MATVVSVSALQAILKQLGWDSVVNANDIPALLSTNAIAATEAYAYLSAVQANPSGVNDQTIAGCAGTSATKLTNYFKGKGVEAV